MPLFRNGSFAPLVLLCAGENRNLTKSQAKGLQKMKPVGRRLYSSSDESPSEKKNTFRNEIHSAAKSNSHLLFGL